uniref:Uncharacterized protein n=1 Tax=Phakopsora pachyrhizi TaxID=170000 RepID=A0A0S1MK08_PHAPC
MLCISTHGRLLRYSAAILLLLLLVGWTVLDIPCTCATRSLGDIPHLYTRGFP